MPHRAATARATAASLLVLIAASCYAPARAQPPEATPIPLEDEEPYTHAATGFEFPAEVSLFDRVGAHRYDDAERNVAVGYIDRALKIILTAYVYPNEGAKLAPHFKQIKDDVRQVHPKARLASEGKWTLKPGGNGGAEVTGLRATFTFSAEFAGKQRELLSDAYLLRHGAYFIKFRITYPADRRDEVAERVSRFFGALKLPKATAANSR